MANEYKIEGVLSQTVVNTDISVVRRTGVRPDKFEAVIPLYVRLDWEPNILEGVITPFNLVGVLRGNTSLVELQNIVVCPVAGGPVPMIREWERAAFFPTMFDEEVTVSISTYNMPVVATLNYVFYYEIKVFSELEMVQAIANY